MSELKEKSLPSRVEANESVAVALETTGDFALDATVREIHEAKERGGAVLVIGALSASREAGAMFSSGATESAYSERIQTQFPEGVLVLSRRQEGYTPEQVKYIVAQNKDKTIVIDAPIFYESIMQKPWEDSGIIFQEKAELRGDGARDWLRGLLKGGRETHEGAVESPKLEEVEGKMAEVMREMQQYAGALGGRLEIALPPNALSLAFAAFIAKKHLAMPEEVLDYLLATIGSEDGALFVRFGDDEPSLWYQGRKVT